MILQSLLLSATAPGSGGAVPSIDGGSLTLRPDADPKIAFVSGMGQALTPSSLRLTGPSGHDASYGVNYALRETRYTHVWRSTPRFSRGETMVARLFGSATAGDVEVWSVALAYRVDGGLFVTADEALEAVEVHTLNGSLTPTVTGAFPAGVPLSSFQDSLRAQRRYALLGFTVANQQDILGLSIRGPDTGNVWQLWPAWNAAGAGSHILALGALTGTGVPVIQAGNASQTTIGLVGNENGTARHVSLVVGLLPK